MSELACIVSIQANRKFYKSVLIFKIKILNYLPFLLAPPLPILLIIQPSMAGRIGRCLRVGVEGI